MRVVADGIVKQVRNEGGKKKLLYSYESCLYKRDKCVKENGVMGVQVLSMIFFLFLVANLIAEPLIIPQICALM
jgi:hypothetical protein